MASEGYWWPCRRPIGQSSSAKACASPRQPRYRSVSPVAIMLLMPVRTVFELEVIGIIGCGQKRFGPEVVVLNGVGGIGGWATITRLVLRNGVGAKV